LRERVAILVLMIVIAEQAKMAGPCPLRVQKWVWWLCSRLAGRLWCLTRQNPIPEFLLVLLQVPFNGFASTEW